MCYSTRSLRKRKVQGKCVKWAKLEIFRNFFPILFFTFKGGTRNLRDPDPFSRLEIGNWSGWFLISLLLIIRVAQDPLSIQVTAPVHFESSFDVDRDGLSQLVQQHDLCKVYFGLQWHGLMASQEATQLQDNGL